MKFNCEKLISFIIDKNLGDILKMLLSSIKTYFNTQAFEIQLEKKYRDENWIVINILTGLDAEPFSF